jgi:hypothetical protein
LTTWLIAYGKKNLPTVYLNDRYVASSGIPKELLNIIDIDRIILDVTMQHRVIMETLGVILQKKALIRDQFNMPKTTAAVV